MKYKTKHALYRTWAHMIERCESTWCKDYVNYGARGIYVCEKWRKSFEAFVEDMGPRPHGHSLDRINVNGNYEPSNCRWADRITQARNNQKKRLIEVDGKEIHVAELSDVTGVPASTIYERVRRGMSIEDATSHQKFLKSKETIKIASKVAHQIKRDQTHCKRGHALEGDNLKTYKGMRHCLKCKHARYQYLKSDKSLSFDDFVKAYHS